MQLCFITHTKLSHNGENYLAFPPIAKLMAMLAPLYDTVELCAPLGREPISRNTSPLVLDNLTVRTLPHYFNRWEVNAFRHPGRLMRAIWGPIRAADTVLISTPNYLSLLACAVCRIQAQPYALRLAGNFGHMMRLNFEYRHMPRLGRLAGWLHHLATKAMVSGASLSIATGQELVDLYGRHNTRVIRVTSSTYCADEVAPRPASSQSPQCHLLYVGRFDQYKGIFELLHATRNLLDTGLNVRTQLVGDGPRRADLEALVRKLNLQDNVDFLGFVANEALRDIYRRNDIFVLPSYSEGMPKVVPEAMSNGLPTVTTDVGGIPRVAQNGRTGFFVKPKDVPALTEALRQLVADEPLRRNMASAALEQSRRFTIEAERDHVQHILNQAGLAVRGVEPQTSTSNV